LVFEIELQRLPGVQPFAGMVSLTFRPLGAPGRAIRLGAVTDSALRARVAHFDVHSANEIAALRLALQPDGGRFALTESWSSRDACLRHWFGFLGSKLETVEWKCEKCGAEGVERVGRAVGEAVYLRCTRDHPVAVRAPEAATRKN